MRYNPYDPEHAERSSQAVYMADGVKRLPNAFSTILDEVSFTSSPTDPILTAFRGSAFLKRRSFEKPIAISRGRERVLTALILPLRLTRGALEIHVGLIPILVSHLIADYSLLV